MVVIPLHYSTKAPYPPPPKKKTETKKTIKRRKEILKKTNASQVIALVLAPIASFVRHKKPNGEPF